MGVIVEVTSAEEAKVAGEAGVSVPQQPLLREIELPEAIGVDNIDELDFVDDHN